MGATIISAAASISATRTTIISAARTAIISATRNPSNACTTGSGFYTKCICSITKTGTESWETEEGAIEHYCGSSTCTRSSTSTSATARKPGHAIQETQ